jgi:hypothetical protein
METLNRAEIASVAGAGDLRRPVDDPKSNAAQMVNEAAQVLNDFGKWLGGEIYDLINSEPKGKKSEELPEQCKKK